MATLPGDLLTIAQVAELVGLSKWTVTARAGGTRQIPYLKLGGSIRYRRQDIEEWLERNTVRPTNLRRIDKRRA